MSIVLRPYVEQVKNWPTEGRHILAQFDESSIIVYQAYRPSIGAWAVQHGRLGGPEFSLSRMSWIKPTFLWMMYRSGWGTKVGQEVTLGVRISREFFESLLAAAVESRFDSRRYATEAAWAQATAASNVRLQWDPDHHPSGAAVQRRSLQLGLRGDALSAFATREVIEIVDASNVVAAQRLCVQAGRLNDLQTPEEAVSVPARPDAVAGARLE